MENTDFSVDPVAPESQNNNGKTPSSKLFKIVVAVFLIGLFAAGGIYYFLSSAKETPPSLSLGTGGLQGFIGTGKYLEFTQADLNRAKDFDKTVNRSAGVQYYYTDKAMTYQEIIESIAPKDTKLKCLFAYYDSTEDNFFTYPEGPYDGTELIKSSDLDNDKLPKNQGFLLVCSDTYATEKGSVHSGDEKPATVAYSLDDFEDGWNLATASTDAELTGLVDDCSNRVSSVWVQEKDNDFVKTDRNDATLEDGYYMVWFKLNGDGGTCVGGAGAAYEPVGDITQCLADEGMVKADFVANCFDGVSAADEATAVAAYEVCETESSTDDELLECMDVALGEVAYEPVDEITQCLADEDSVKADFIANCFGGVSAADKAVAVAAYEVCAAENNTSNGAFLECMDVALGGGASDNTASDLAAIVAEAKIEYDAVQLLIASRVPIATTNALVASIEASAVSAEAQAVRAEGYLTEAEGLVAYNGASSSLISKLFNLNSMVASFSKASVGYSTPFLPSNQLNDVSVNPVLVPNSNPILPSAQLSTGTTNIQDADLNFANSNIMQVENPNLFNQGTVFETFWAPSKGTLKERISVSVEAARSYADAARVVANTAATQKTTTISQNNLIDNRIADVSSYYSIIQSTQSVTTAQTNLDLLKASRVTISSFITSVQNYSILITNEKNINLEYLENATLNANLAQSALASLRALIASGDGAVPSGSVTYTTETDITACLATGAELSTCDAYNSMDANSKSKTAVAVFGCAISSGDTLDSMLKCIDDELAVSLCTEGAADGNNKICVNSDWRTCSDTVRLLSSDKYLCNGRGNWYTCNSFNDKKSIVTDDGSYACSAGIWTRDVSVALDQCTPNNSYGTNSSGGEDKSLICQSGEFKNCANSGISLNSSYTDDFSFVCFNYRWTKCTALLEGVPSPDGEKLCRAGIWMDEPCTTIHLNDLSDRGKSICDESGSWLACTDETDIYGYSTVNRVQNNLLCTLPPNDNYYKWAECNRDVTSPLSLDKTWVCDSSSSKWEKCGTTHRAITDVDDAYRAECMGDSGTWKLN